MGAVAHSSRDNVASLRNRPMYTVAMLLSLRLFLVTSCYATLAPLASAQSFQDLIGPNAFSNMGHTTTEYGSGGCAADFDGDGDVDVVLADAELAPFGMFRNDGGFVFVDVSAGSGLGLCGKVRCMQSADIDNDGDQDIYVGNFLQPAQLFLNDGTGVFSEQSLARGIVHATDNFAATFGDFDRDGWLDLYVGNRFTGGFNSVPQANILYRNVGNGTFVDVTAAAGVAGNRPTLVCVFFDFDEDGWPDLLEVNDKGNVYGPNELYRNNGNGTFTAVAAQYGAQIAIDGMGMDFVDAFCDGGVDFYCTDVPFDHLFQKWDAVQQRYTNATAVHGLTDGGTGWACNFLDYDNDGWQDLHVVQMGSPNLLYRNPGQPASALAPWSDQAAVLGVASAYWQFTAMMADFDDDGRVDMLQRFPDMIGTFKSPVSVLVQRNNVPGGNWLKFATTGTVSNRDGIGARIEVQTGTHHQRQWVRSGVGYIASSDPRVHFGIGAAAAADLVTVTWPSGQRQYLHNLPANQTVGLVEPRMTVSGPAPVGGSATITTSIPGDGLLPYMTLLSLSNQSGIALPDGNVVPIDFDVLTQLILTPGNFILPQSFGFLDASGNATATLNVPPLPFLSGITVYAATLTTDAPRFPVARTVIAKAVTVSIQ